jgi:POT family proton-dependent oligopeptide transporter
MSTTPDTPEQKPRARYPRAVAFIIGNEAAERFSFYGMRNILTVFLINYLLLQEIPDEESRTATAKATFHLFVSGVYFFPLLGGYLADRYLGKYRTVLYLSLLYCVGHAFLAFFEGSKNGFYAGLFLIALGSGGIKPCVSAFVGDQFDESNKELVKGVFGLFYWIINFGSFFASLLIPVTLDKWGPSVAFGIPGLLMLLATVIFWLGRKHYVDVPPTGHNPHSFLRVVWSALVGQRPAGGDRLAAAEAAHPAEAVEGARAVFRVMGIFAAVPIFWALFDQKASTWVVQATQMDLQVGDITLAPSQLQALNPLMVMLLIPFLSFVVFPWFERKGWAPTALRRMTAGMFIAGISFLMVGAIQVAMDGGRTLSVLWQVGPYLVLTLAEVLVSATGLEFAYSQAPREMKGTIMSFWSLTVTVGNLLVAGVSAINVFEGAAGSLFFYAGLIFLAALLFAFIASRYKVRDYFQPAPVPVLGEHSEPADPRGTDA